MTEQESGAPRRSHYDAVVIGGGSAGLGGALALARARRRVLVVDAGEPRNAPAAGVHVFLTRDGTPPGELLAAARAEVAGYGGEVVRGRVREAEPTADGGFLLRLADHCAPVTARRLLIATGLVDHLPEGVVGLAERWGRDVLHCPYCHGWEVRDREIAVLAGGPMGVHAALLWRQWSPSVTLLPHTGAEPDAEAAERLAARGVRVVTGEAAGLDVADDALRGVRLANGQLVPCQALVAAARMEARLDGLEGLGLTPTDFEMAGAVLGSYLATDQNGATSVPGVWAAGNVSSLSEQVMGAAAAGVRAGAMINADLIEEETRQAVAARAAT